MNREDIRAFYLQMRAICCELEHRRDLVSEAIMELDVNLHSLKLQLDAFSVGIKNLDQPYKETKEHTSFQLPRVRNIQIGQRVHGQT